MSALYKPLIDFLTGNFPFSGEGIILGQAFGAALAIKNGPNKEGKLHWFHAFVLSVLTGFSGGLFNVMWMGKVTPMISNDVVFASCAISFVVVNYVPFGVTLLNVLPVKIVVTMFGTLFKSLGLCNFAITAFTALDGSPSRYYPIPVFGPIFYGVMLGNMGGFVLNGINGYLSGGMPWPFQNGIACAPFFHFYAHDKSGPIGDLLRKVMSPVHALFPDIDDRTFSMAFVGLFMQVVSILQLPSFLGPSFSPFVAIGSLINAPVDAALSKDDMVSSPPKPSAKSVEAEDDDDEVPKGIKTKKPKRKKNKQKKA